MMARRWWPPSWSTAWPKTSPSGGLKLRVSASIGVAVCGQGEGSCEDLLRRADEAMYRAKRAGKNRFVMDAA